jgi:hypothetical protein
MGEWRWDPWHQSHQLAAHSLFIDPARAWQPGRRPFGGGGDPTHQDPHFELVAGAPDIYARTVEQFNDEVPVLDAAHLQRACQ